MELKGQQHIGVPRQKVWDALNDPSILSRCVPGCEEIVKASETEMHARVLLKIGPVRARFAGKIFMTDVQAPDSCVLRFEGAGGAAGFAKGSSQVRLLDDGDGTALEYTVEASVGGKLGQIGGRLIDSSARKMADEFFTAFNAALTGADAEPHAQADNTPQHAIDGIRREHGPRPVTRSETSPFSGGFSPELYRAFWFVLGVATTLLISRYFS